MQLSHTTPDNGVITWSREEHHVYRLGDRIQATIKQGKILLQKSDMGASVASYGADELNLTLPRATPRHIPIMGITPTEFDYEGDVLSITIPKKGRVLIPRIRTKKISRRELESNPIEDAVNLINQEKERVGAGFKISINEKGLLEVEVRQRYGP